MELVFSIFTKNYLAQIRVLYNSLKSSNPEQRFVAVLLDNADDYFEINQEPFEIIEGLPIIKKSLSEKKLFCSTALEISCTVKPLIAKYLIESRPVKQLLYLDSDMLILGDLAPIFELLEDNSLILFPQVLSPHPSRHAYYDRNLLTFGIFNAGMFAVSSCPQTLSFLNWWLKRNIIDCSTKHSTGNYLDQKWLNLAAIFYEPTYIYRGLECNVAIWNLFERPLKYQNQTWLCGDIPIITWHMSLPWFDVKSIEKYQLSESQEDRSLVKQFYQDYHENLKLNGLNLIQQWPFLFDYFNNGKRIPSIKRKLIQSLGLRISEEYPLFDKGKLRYLPWWLWLFTFYILKELRGYVRLILKFCKFA